MRKFRFDRWSFSWYERCNFLFFLSVFKQKELEFKTPQIRFDSFFARCPKELPSSSLSPQILISLRTLLHQLPKGRMQRSLSDPGLARHSSPAQRGEDEASAAVELSTYQFMCASPRTPVTAYMGPGASSFLFPSLAPSLPTNTTSSLSKTWHFVSLCRLSLLFLNCSKVFSEKYGTDAFF